MYERRHSSIRRFVLMVWSCLWFSVALSAQTVTFLDAQGQPATAPYLEGSRAYLRVVDPGASGSVGTAVSAARSGDYELLDLLETGSGTGVFEGSIELSNAFPSADGRLQTGRDTSQYPWRFDDLSATYAPGMASDSAATVGSTVSTFDGAGALTTTYVVGDTIYLEVTDAFANSTAGVDTASVNLSTVVGSWGEYQTVLLTETGGDTSTFAGSIQTVPGSSPVQQDGIFEVQPGSAVWVQHDDANGQTYSAVQLSIYPNQPVSLAFVDEAGQPAESYQEFGTVYLRATDGALAGQWWGLTVRLTSDLRGDEEYVSLSENPFFSGVFTGSVTARGQLSGAPVANDGILEVSEVAGSPVERDTIRAEILDCVAAPCPTDTAAMTGTVLRITDEQWHDLELIVAPATISLEARDGSVYYDAPTSATVTSGADSETVTLDPAWQNPAGAPQYGRFRGSVPVEVGAAVVGDGYLQVAASDVVTASRPDPLGLSSAVDTATVGGGLLTFLDANGAPVDYVLANFDVRVRAVAPSANVDPGAADTLAISLVSRRFYGPIDDTESLQLVETGVDTGVFIGQMPSRMNAGQVSFDGELQTGYGSEPDTIEATLDATTAIATIRPGILRFVDGSGADVEILAADGAIGLALETRAGTSPTYPDQIAVTVRSLSSGDEEYVYVLETGDFTSLFFGSVPSALSAPVPYDGTLQVQAGETVRVSFQSYFGPMSDLATVEGGSGNLAPIALDDNATTPDSTPVSVPVLSNDSDPEGQPLMIASFSQGTSGGTVSAGGGGALTYTPPSNFTGYDSFTYQVVDPEGASASATAWVLVEFVNDPPVVYGDFASTPEDTAVTIQLLANDSDPEGQALTLDAVFPGSLGTVVITNAAAGTVLYTPHANTYGVDTFTYRVRDPQGLTSLGYVDVTIQPVNDPPIAVDDAVTTAEDTLVSVFPRANDSDPDGDTIWISAPWPQAAHGQVGATATMFNYQPAANYNGTDTVTYTINDGNGRTATAKVTITITPVPDPPVAATDNVTTPEDTVLVVAPLANDSDPDGDAFSILSVTTAFHGTLAINGDGTVTYTPAANYSGTDRFDYTIQDATGRTATGRVNLTLTPVNDPPDAVNDSANVNEDSSVTVFVRSNDSDPDGDLTFVQSVTQGAHGAVTMSGGLPVYTPVANYFGPDTFTYTLSDGKGGTDVATVSITVSNVQDPPSAAPDVATTAEDVPVVVSVLANDSDADGNTLTVFAVSAAAHGTVTFTATTVRYVPNANYFGPDSFTYSVNDGTGRSVSGVVVSLTVASVNDGPVAGNDVGLVAEDGSVTLSVLGNDTDLDGDSLAVTGVTQGANGAVSFNAGSVTYTPTANFHGSDSFTYTIGDGNGGSATASVSITVSSSNDAPSVADDAATTAEDTAVTVSVLGNDTDLDGDSLAVTSVTQGANGAVSFNAGSVTYTPAANFHGSDSFTYTIADGNGGSATASVSITVSPVNDAPVAANDLAATLENTPIAIAVLANDTDVDGDALTVLGVTQGSRGSVSINGNGTVTYTPNAGTSGADGFSYTIRDAAGLQATASVTVAVTGVNESPDAVNDSATTVEASGGVTIAVLANDTDPDGDPLIVTAVSTPAHGTASVNPDNTVTFVPVASYSGSDSFTYTVSDGAATDVATVTVQVKESISRVVVLATNSLWVQTGADILSGDVITNQAGASPFLNSSSEVTIAGNATTAAGWDVQGKKVTVASGAVVASDVHSTQLVNNGTVSGALYSPLALPVFTALPAFLPSTPGTNDLTVSTNGTLVLAPGSYRDLIVNKKGTVTFTGGTYHFRSIRIAIEAKLYFSAPSTICIQDRMSTANLVAIRPTPTGSTATAASIVFHVAGINGTTGALSANPKPVEIGNDNTVSANFYAPNGTLWIRDRAIASGAFFGKDVMVGPDSQVTLSSAW